MKPHSNLNGFAFAIVIGLLACCDPSGAWAAAGKQKLILVVPHRVFFTVALPVYVAQEKGFYKEGGIEVDAVFTKGGGENVQAVVSGDAQIGLATGVFAVLSAFEKGAPIKIAAAEIAGMDSFWYALANSPIRRLEDLSAKKIAYSRPGSSTHMAVLAIADQVKAKGLPPPEPVSLGGLPDTYTGVRTGQADLGWSVPPFMLDRVEKGELRIVVRGSEIEALNDITMRVHFVNADFAAKQPDAVRAFFRAHQRAVGYMMDHPQESAKIWIRKAELKFPESVVLKTWEFYRKPALALKPIRGIQTTIQDAMRFKFLKAPLGKADLERLIDLSLVP
ncbi:MAG TPA: ABC transporter substrate-binding protein [Candidatus Eisenbacteria bacterium]|nr:ABC transporter substrate-binding protein [Candidatus Eisenbacteria bacterium]